MKVNDIIEKKQFAAVTCLDQSACFDIIDHKILIAKLSHIGFDINSINLIKSYFFERKQYVELNTKKSEVLLTGSHSVYQGSVLSCLFSNIYILDLPLISHEVNHINHLEYFKCSKTFMCTYVDDCFSVISGNKNNIWKQIKQYIDMVEKYYNANKLKLNTGKTQILIIGKNNSTVNGNLILEGNTVHNSRNMKILGTIFSQQGNWNENVTSGSSCMLTQLKHRENAVVRTANHFDIKFKFKLLDSLLLGKIRYNLATWGNLSMKFKNKINNLIKNTVKKLTKNIYYERKQNTRLFPIASKYMFQTNIFIVKQ